MLVVDIRQVGMFMLGFFMCMGMTVLASKTIRVKVVVMAVIMGMPVFMRFCQVLMKVHMLFG